MRIREKRSRGPWQPSTDVIGIYPACPKPGGFCHIGNVARGSHPSPGRTSPRLKVLALARVRSPYSGGLAKARIVWISEDFLGHAMCVFSRVEVMMQMPLAA